MQTISKREKIPFPSGDLAENFQFDCAAEGGNFTFHFKWLNDRWNLWVTLPDGKIRQAGVLPGVISWSEFSDFGLVFETNFPVDFHRAFSFFFRSGRVYPAVL